MLKVLQYRAFPHRIAVLLEPLDFADPNRDPRQFRRVRLDLYAHDIGGRSLGLRLPGEAAIPVFSLASDFVFQILESAQGKV